MAETESLSVDGSELRPGNVSSRVSQAEGADFHVILEEERDQTGAKSQVESTPKSQPKQMDVTKVQDIDSEFDTYA